MISGYLKAAITSIQSQYYKSEMLKVQIKTNQILFSNNIWRSGDGKLQEIWTLLPAQPNIQIFVYENKDKSDSKYGYFNIPVSKIYESNQSHHLINVNCVLRDKLTNNMINQTSAVLKLALVKQPSFKAELIFSIKSAKLERDTEAFGKMDPFVICRVGKQQKRTKVKDQAGKNPVWLQKIEYVIEQIPQSISLTVKDEDVTSDDLVGQVSLDPHKDAILVYTDRPIERQLEILYEGKRAGTILISTMFKE